MLRMLHNTLNVYKNNKSENLKLKQNSEILICMRSNIKIEHDV
jgi:hypothetical protein